MERKEKLVELFLENGIVEFRPEEPVEEEHPKIKSPMYTNFPKIVDHPEICSLITEILAIKIDHEINERGFIFDFVVGTSVAGIQIGKLIAKKYDKPFTRIKSGQTYSGNSGDVNFLVESHDPTNKKALIVEDLIYTNGNIIKEAQLIIRMGASVEMGASILIYNNPDFQIDMSNIKIPLIHTLTIDEVLIICIKKKIIKSTDSDILKKFFVDPTSWYQRNFPGTVSN